VEEGGEGEEGEEGEEEGEVDAVIGHSCDANGNYTFTVLFTDGTTEEICDEYCNCEYLIALYLETVSVKTIYCICRVSTKKQNEDNCLSLNSQEVELRKAAQEAKENYGGEWRVKVVRFVSSAYCMVPRPVQIVCDAACKDSIIMALRICRLSRSISFISQLDELRRRGVGVCAVKDRVWYHNNQISFVSGLISSQRESELRGEHVRQALKYCKEQRGDERVGALPYGQKYETVENGRKIVVDDPEAVEIIRGIRQSSLSNMEMARQLNMNGFLKKRGNGEGRKWSRAMVARIRKG